MVLEKSNILLSSWQGGWKLHCRQQPDDDDDHDHDDGNDVDDCSVGRIFTSAHMFNGTYLQYYGKCIAE